MRHHEETLAAFADDLRSDDGVLAVIVTGSVARGTERTDSDVDVCVLVDEERFREEAARDGLSYVRHEPATYDGGYVDVKVISPLYLERAATAADQATRASFLGARVDRKSVV